MTRKAQAAAMFCVSRPTLRKWVARGLVPDLVKIDGTRLWLRDELVTTAKRLVGYVAGWETSGKVVAIALNGLPQSNGAGERTNLEPNLCSSSAPRGSTTKDGAPNERELELSF